MNQLCEKKPDSTRINSIYCTIVKEHLAVGQFYDHLPATNACPVVEKIGISFRSTLSSEQLRAKYINSLRSALRHAKAGIYSNHLRQVDPQGESTEHLLVFEVHDFKEGLRILRLELDKIGLPEGLALHNLNPSQPGY